MSFLDSRLHARHVVLGRELHPLCLLDILALEMVGSPFLNSGVVKAHDVAIAVHILSTPHQRMLYITPDAAKPGFWLKAKAAIAGARGVLWRDVKKIEAYIRDHSASADVLRENIESATPLGAHWTQTLSNNLS